MDSNPALGFLGFWMMMQLVATLALLIGGIYLMFCLGRAASGLDRMANAMEDWIALQSAQAQRGAMPSAPSAPQAPSAFGQSTPSAPIPPPSTPFTPVSAPPQPPREYSVPDESVR